MRARLLTITLMLLVQFLAAPRAVAQSNPQYITLYAHGFGVSATLTALPQANSGKAAILSNGLAFQLNPVLGTNLQIDGAVTYNLYLRATAQFAGMVSAQLDDLKPDGTRVFVPATSVSAPVFLNPATILVTLGVGPAISYQFDAGSSILLQIGITQTSGPGQPQLVWDDASAPTSVRLPAIAPTTAEIQYSGPRDFGRIFQTEANGTQRVTVNATLTDPIGVYRFSTVAMKFTAQNGTAIGTLMNPKNVTDYSTSYIASMSFGQGEWQVGLALQDSSGNSYSFAQPLWVTTFYPVSIAVLDSDGASLSNATLTVDVDAQSFWSSVTNQTGWGALTLPSTDIVGPLNLTVSWSGTRSLFPLDVTHAATVTVQLTVYATNVRVTMMNMPVPFARVTLYQTGEVGENSTGIDGTATFGRLPAGTYTVTVEYLLSSYQTSLHLSESGIIPIAVPFPHRTATTILAVAFVALASVVLVGRKRGKLYPSTFAYFKELTHGGLPEACFTIIAGNSGSGKTVLLNSLSAEQLAGGNAIYVANTDYPDKIRSDMVKLGVLKESEANDPHRLIFVDAYSAVAGSQSREEYSVTSYTDLTNLGLNISKCLETAPGDVYIDSLNPLIAALRTDYLINFLQTVAARLKARNGRLIATVGTGIDEHDLTKLEEAADCVIQTQLNESGSRQLRRLRIKKLRGKPYNDRWVRFRVQEGRGIVFLTHKKTSNHLANE